MRTTARLDENLLRQVKLARQECAETMPSMIEQGSRLLWASSQRRPRSTGVKLPVSRATGGTLPGIDLNHSARLLDRMECRP